LQLDKYENLIGNISPRAIILVGGLSKSGKTTFANEMSSWLGANHISSIVLSIDRWLLDIDQRTATVMGRYDTHQIICIINALINRSDDIDIPFPDYDKSRKVQINQSNTLTVRKDCVVIVEGVIAINLLYDMPVDMIYFIEVDEAVRKQRVIQEYLLRGHSEDSSVDIYNARELDETPIVMSVFECSKSLKIKRICR
jgi:uridine kinase